MNEQAILEGLKRIKRLVSDEDDMQILLFKDEIIDICDAAIDTMRSLKDDN